MTVESSEAVARYYPSLENETQLTPLTYYKTRMSELLLGLVLVLVDLYKIYFVFISIKLTVPSREAVASR